MTHPSVSESLVRTTVRFIVLACLAAPGASIAQEDGEDPAAPAADIARQGDDDLALPPRIDNVPSQARLAAPPEDRIDTIEEVIVTDDNPWGLPDLGSTWRAREAQTVETGRIRANFLPLYDPDDPASLLAPLFPANREMQRVGFIQLFRIRFGGRDTDD